MDEGLYDGLLSKSNENFRGFTQATSKGRTELKQCLGINISPDVRTYQYNGDPKFKGLHLAAANLTGIKGPRYDFLHTPDHRGAYRSEYKAVFVKPEDPFVELHELGHAFVEKNNPDLHTFYIDGRKGARGVEDRIAGFAIDEGLAQWIGIAASYKTGDPKRIKQAIFENRKMLKDPRISNIFFDPSDHTLEAGFEYDPEIVAYNIENVKAAIQKYKDNPVVRRNAQPHLVQEEYMKIEPFTQTPAMRQAMSLGYVYTASKVAEEAASGGTISSSLTNIIKYPPNFTELETRVRGFDGNLSFQALHI